MIGLFSKKLLREFGEFENPDRARFVYYKCLAKGHPHIAARILKKHGPFHPSDSALAFGYALLANKAVA